MGIEEAILCLVLMKTGHIKTEARCEHLQIIIEESEKQQIDPLLTTAIVFHESYFTAAAVSDCNACGLMQVLPKFSEYSCKQLKNPQISISEGLLKYKKFLLYANGKRSYALCLYNMGYKCTKFRSNSYSRKVLKTYRILKRYYRKLRVT